MIERLAPLVNSRPASLLKASPESNLQKLRRRIHSRDFEVFRDDVIRHWLIGSHRGILIDFLNASGIPQNNGFVAEGLDDIPSKDSMVNGIQGVIGRHPYKAVMIYLGYLIVWGGETWQNLLPAFHESERILQPPPDDVSERVDSIQNEVSSADQEALPEASDRFTPLDNILIRSAVATAADEMGALLEPELEELIEEVIRLNSKKSRSVFHRGFFDALFSNKTEYGSAAENAERRMWYLTGLLMGMLRRNKTAEILSLIKQKKDVFKEICEDEHNRCGVMILPSLFPILWECAEYETAFALLKGQLPKMNEKNRLEMAIDVHEKASTLLRTGGAETSGNFFDLLNRLVSDEDDFRADFREYFLPRNNRRRAQVQMLRGEFPAASRLLQPLVDSPDESLSAEASADLALVKSSFRSFQSLYPMPTEDDAKAKARALVSAEEILHKAVSKETPGSANARICLGIVALFGSKNNAAAATIEFSSALAGIMERSSLYEVGGVLQWVKLLHVLSLLESADESGLFQVRTLLSEIRAGGERYPAWILRRMLAAASLFDDKSFAAEIAEVMLAQEGDVSFDEIWESGLPLQVPELGARYCQWMLSTQLSSKAKWPRCMQLLEFMLIHARLEDAAALLDAMEVIASKSREYADEFLEFLEDDGNYSPAWDHGDAELCRINLANKHGRIEDARAYLNNRFHDKRTTGNSRDLEEASGILEWLGDLNEDADVIQRLRKLLHAEEFDHCMDDQGIASLSGRILFVGGNETQAQYKGDVAREVKEFSPHLEIEFINPGWSSNWNQSLEDIRRRLPGVDALVLSPLVRTQLGRSIRKECDDEKPWFPCTGRGRASIVRSVMNAARWMASK
jgi:hypothetical protein